MKFRSEPLANSKQATKRARQAEKHRLHNASQKSGMRTRIKQVLSLISAGKKDEANVAMKEATIGIDRLAGRNLIHANKAARLKSRLNKKIKEA